MIAILLILNVTLLVLFLKEIKSTRSALRVIQETGNTLALLQDSLARTDMQKAFVHLAEARRQIGSAVPPAPAAPTAKQIAEAPAPAAKAAAEPKAPPAPAAAKTEAKAPAVAAKAETKAPAAPGKATALLIPAGETPVPLISVTAGEYALIGEKESKLLHLFKFQDEQFTLVKSYPSIFGANGEDKKKEGDFATPKGSYFTLRYTPGSALPDIYGEGAFVLNYPNFLDRKDRKDGTGIWIHGHAPGKVIGTGDLVNTKGCIALSNGHIKELKGLLRPSGTPVSIVDRVAFVKEGSRKESLREVRAFMDAWRLAWESGNTGKYLGHYSKDFINSDGMRFEAFKRHKERVNSGKKFIRVTVDQMAVLFPQEREGQVAVVRFIQKYRSNNFESNSKKLFYLKKERGGWTIFGESAF